MIPNYSTHRDRKTKTRFKRKQSMETEPEMVQTFEFIDKDFIGAITNKLENVKENISIMSEKIGNLCRGIYRLGAKVGLQL